MENKNGSSQSYPYCGLPLTPEIIQYWIPKLFGGKTVARKDIVKAVQEAHSTRGGDRARAADLSRSVKKALKNLANDHKAVNRMKGFWQIVSESELPDQIPPVDEDLQHALGGSTDADLQPADHIRGDGPSCVYVYFFDVYKKYAEITGDDRWPCKIGRTDVDPLSRIKAQASTALPEPPHIALELRTHHPAQLESTIHFALQSRNLRITEAPGNEWFNTSPDEIREIVQILVPNLFSNPSADKETE